MLSLDPRAQEKNTIVEDVKQLANLHAFSNAMNSKKTAVAAEAENSARSSRQ